MNARLRQTIFRRDGMKCQICGKAAADGARLEVDHKTPKARGGTNAKDNLWTLCRECNRGKRDRWDDGEARDWEDLIELEPRLADIADDILRVARSKGFCANQAWYPPHGQFRTRMQNLVGWLREDKTEPRLCGQRAYHIAYDHLYNLLPNCNHPVQWIAEGIGVC